MRALRVGRPIWLSQPSRDLDQRYGALTRQLEVDVAIVGGGITGALAATVFAKAGVRVAVLEAGRIGQGSTAASTALLLREPDMGLVDLGKMYGPARARRIWRLSADAASGFVDLIRRERIECTLERRESVYYTLDREAVAPLRRELAARERAGFVEDWLSPGALRRKTGIAGAGGLRSRANVQFDPYAACVGLVRAAARHGAAIFERSRVTGIVREPRGVRLSTSRGRVRASQVIVATGYATPDFKPLAGRFRLDRTYVLATAPLDARARRELGLEDVMLWDTARPYHYVRWTPDRRLLLGGADRPASPGRTRAAAFAGGTADLRRYFERLWPALAELEITAAWEGLFATTPDGLPYIGPHRRYPRHLFALGYGGNGMTFGFLAARMLLEQWQGRRSPDHALFSFNR